MMLARRMVLMAAVLLCGLSAGFFYAYSVSVIPGFAVVAPEHAVAGMQAINSVIRTAVFAVTFFGTLVIGLIAALLYTVRARQTGRAALIWLGVLSYAVGVIGVTFAVNVPLNEALAGAHPSADEAAAIWRGFVEPWSWWNDLRTISATATLALWIVALAPTRG